MRELVEIGIWRVYQFRHNQHDYSSEEMEANVKYLAVARTRDSVVLASLSCDFSIKDKVRVT